MKASEFFELAFNLAGESTCEVQCFRLGGYQLRVEFSSSELALTLGRAIAHTRASANEGIELQVRCFEEGVTDNRLPPPPWSWEDALPRGSFRGWEKGRYRVQYNRIDGRILNLLLMDTYEAKAVYWVKKCEDIPWWERTFPFRQIIHWWSNGKQLQPVHSGAVGFSSGGVLISGRSGSGKSTSCLSCLHSELQYVGDDFVLIDLESHQPRVHSLYATAKIEPTNLHRFPWIKPWISNPDQLDSQKALIQVSESAPEKLCKSFPIQAILLPKVTGKFDSQLSPASSANAMHALAPSTVLTLIGDESEVMRKISQLVRTVPAYWLEAGTDLTQIPLRIKEFLKGGA
jgi:hypothetical protein